MKSIVWRQKEQFSDRVGYNWIDTLKKVVEDQISDQKMEEASLRFPIQTPTTKKNITTDPCSLNIFHQILLHFVFHKTFSCM